VSILVADQLKVDPVPFLIGEVLSSNVGGTATLIGDPPNILIGSAAHLSFAAFLWNLAPVVLVLLGSIVLCAWLLFGRRLHVSNERKALIMDYDESKTIKDPRLLRTCLVVGGLTLVGFLFHGLLGVQPAAVALAGASGLLLVTRLDPAPALEKVEWTTLFFFIGLFLVVGGAQVGGLIAWFTRLVPASAARHPFATGVGTLWVSGLLSGVVDNIPLTAAAIPVLREIAASTGSASVGEGLWWCLALGACLGGNATAVGASANVVVFGIAERSGCPISFRRFLLYGLPFTVLSLAICTVYVWLRYFLP
jgi:Na+/H+ antiporter NhaD/arsenite permease-like protein